jgi:tetratricopeptide (TPR) repeat protein
MSSIEELKAQARRHEQKEEWQPARDLYMRAIDRLDGESQTDIGLYNRVGDILVKIGDYEFAMEHFQRAIELYVEAELPNNAIAICKKVVRHLPGRNEMYLRIGQIRAGQGFLVDARENFLTYAAKVEAAGDTEEALRALVEFAELAPEDTQVRMAVGLQLQKHERPEEALEQFVAGYRVLAARDASDDEARAFGERILELDPDADLEALADSGEVLAFESPSIADEHGGDDSFEAAFGEIELPSPGDAEVSAGGAMGSRKGDPDRTPVVEADFGEIVLSHGDDDPHGGLELVDESPPPAGEDFEGVEDVVGDEELPFLTFGDDDFDGPPDPGSTAAAGEADGPGSFDVDPGEEAGLARLPTLPPDGDEFDTVEPHGWETLRAGYDPNEPDTARAEQLVAFAFKDGEASVLVEAYELLARALESEGDAERAREVWEQVRSLEPDHTVALAALRQAGEAPGVDASSSRPTRGSAGAPKEDAGDFVDLGSLVFGTDAQEKTTRFRVAYEEPTGDEEADFAKMLDQFKAKVAESFDASDVKAHHDLGTAYKEMGLLDSARHLPTYELLGQTFMERGEHAAAVRVLERALKIPPEVEDELIGIYYYLGRAHEELDQVDQAVGFYDRVFALDINFADVTSRLRELR